MMHRCLAPRRASPLSRARPSSRGSRSSGSARRARCHGSAPEAPGTSSPDLPPWASPGYKGATVSALREAEQQEVLKKIAGGLAGATLLSASVVAPALRGALPEGVWAFSRATWPLIGVTYVAAGYAHFALEKGFLDMYPHQGAWGVWRLPGTPRFHVAWTGVAEVAGGFGLLSGAYLAWLPAVPEWLESASALGLIALTVAVTPANTYMFTHNAPGPLPEGADESMQVLTPPQHLARAALQVFLWTILWGIATE